MDTLELVQSLGIPKDKQLAAVCEFIDSIQNTNFWDYDGDKMLERWAKAWREDKEVL
jgi:hypothetical protein